MASAPPPPAARCSSRSPRASSPESCRGGSPAGRPSPLWPPVQVARRVADRRGAPLVLIHAFARFVREGVGTPAPVAPTRAPRRRRALPLRAQPDVRRGRVLRARPGAAARPRGPARSTRRAAWSCSSRSCAATRSRRSARSSAGVRRVPPRGAGLVAASTAGTTSRQRRAEQQLVARLQAAGRPARRPAARCSAGSGRPRAACRAARRAGSAPRPTPPRAPCRRRRAAAASSRRRERVEQPPVAPLVLARARRGARTA